MKETLLEVLEENECFCLLNDNKTILPGCHSDADDIWIHPYIFYGVGSSLAENINDALDLPEMWLWAYKYVPDTREDLKKAVSILAYALTLSEDELKTALSEFDLNGIELGSEHSDALHNLCYEFSVKEEDVIEWNHDVITQLSQCLSDANDTLNNAILRVRLGGRYESYGNDVLFCRVSSVGFDWYDAIVNFIDKKHFDGYLTIEYDAQAFGSTTVIDQDLPVEEFIEKEYLVESAKSVLARSAVEANFIRKLSMGMPPKKALGNRPNRHKIFEGLKERSMLLKLY